MTCSFVFRRASFANVLYLVLRLYPVLLWIDCGNQLLNVLMSSSRPLLKIGKIMVPVGPDPVLVL